MKRKLLIALTALTLAPLAASAAFARGVFDDAIEHYNAKRYLQAANAFTKASIKEPSNQLYRYYLANCLVHLDKHDRAVEEYRAAYLLDPYSSTAEYSARALKGYHKPLPPLPGVGADDSQVGKTKTLIRKQSRDQKDKHTIIASNSESLIRAKVDEQIKQIDEQARYEIQKLHDPLIFMPAPRANPLLALPDLLKEKEDQIKLNAKQEKERLLRDAEERSKPFQSWRKDRGAVIDEIAQNLEHQLEQPVGPSGVKLQPNGTDLYVRYYGKSKGSRFPDAHQATARIVPEESGFELPTAPPTEKINADSSHRDVKARLLR